MTISIDSDCKQLFMQAIISIFEDANDNNLLHRLTSNIMLIDRNKNIFVSIYDLQNDIINILTYIQNKKDGDQISHYENEFGYIKDTVEYGLCRLKVKFDGDKDFYINDYFFKNLSNIYIDDFLSNTYAIKNGMLINIKNKTIIQGTNHIKFNQSSIVKIDYLAFYSINFLNPNILIPNNISFICERAFAYSNLSTIQIANQQLSSFEFDVMRNTNLQEIIIPDSIVEIGPGAFSDCYKLTSINCSTHSKLESIQIQSFKNCQNLLSINIPNSINEIEEHAFINCLSLSSIIGYSEKIMNFAGITSLLNGNCCKNIQISILHEK